MSLGSTTGSLGLGRHQHVHDGISVVNFIAKKRKRQKVYGVPMSTIELSVIIPAKNEAASIGQVVAGVRQRYTDAEILIVDDGSSDDTKKTAEEAGATVISHPHSLGNGAAVKTGARNASGETLVFMDGDGQHDPADIPRLLERLEQGFDMVVGARANAKSHANAGRLMANGVYNLVASIVTGHTIPDLTSGFRAVNADKFRKYLYLLPNGFSYPTTITMAFMRSGFPVDFIDIDAAKRVGKSHIRPIHDGLRFHGHYLQDRDTLRTAEVVHPNQRPVLCPWTSLVRLHLRYARPVH